MPHNDDACAHTPPTKAQAKCVASALLVPRTHSGTPCGLPRTAANAPNTVHYSTVLPPRAITTTHLSLEGHDTFPTRRSGVPGGDLIHFLCRGISCVVMSSIHQVHRHPTLSPCWRPGRSDMESFVEFILFPYSGDDKVKPGAPSLFFSPGSGACTSISHISAGHHNVWSLATKTQATRFQQRGHGVPWRSTTTRPGPALGSAGRTSREW